MKVIGFLQGFALFHEPVEEYSPEKQPPISDIIQLITTTYRFASFPVIQPGGDVPTTLNFIAGAFPEEGDRFAINHLIMAPEADLTVTGSAAQSDLVLNHLISLLDNHFGLRLRSSNITKHYVSNLVVEFDRAFEEYIEKLSHIERAINNYRAIQFPRFKFKRLGFGSKAGGVPQADPITMVEEAEFLIERRAGRPFEQNRYFCSAPMITDEHVRVLEEIEGIARG